MRVVLRRFGEKDLANLAVWRDQVSAEQYMEKLAPTAYETAGLGGWGREFVWFVICVDGLDVGCIWIENKKNRRNVGILGIIIGHPEHHGKGVGRLAIRRAVILGRPFLGYDIVRLHVRQTNERAIYCYANCGFVITGEGAKAHEALGKVPSYRMELFLTPMSAVAGARLKTGS